MKITVDDWRFRETTGEQLLIDAFLDNGQHAMIEINPMKLSQVVNGDIPEMIAFCEMPGERLAEPTGAARWISRPPNRTCPWSSVQLPMALLQQVKGQMQHVEAP